MDHNVRVYEVAEDGFSDRQWRPEDMAAVLQQLNNGRVVLMTAEEFCDQAADAGRLAAKAKAYGRMAADANRALGAAEGERLRDTARRVAAENAALRTRVAELEAEREAPRYGPSPLLPLYREWRLSQQSAAAMREAAAKTADALAEESRALFDAEPDDGRPLRDSLSGGFHASAYLADAIRALPLPAAGREANYEAATAKIKAALQKAAANVRAATAPDRCSVCGWPLKATIEEGCTPGNCSQRPRPKMLFIIDEAKSVSPELWEALKDMKLSKDAIVMHAPTDAAGVLTLEEYTACEASGVWPPGYGPEPESDTPAIVEDSHGGR